MRDREGAFAGVSNCVVRRHFLSNSNGSMDDELLRNTVYSEEDINSDTLVDTHGAYKDSPRKVARKKDVVFIDANWITRDLEQGLGVTGSRKLHMWFRPGEVASLPHGRRDNTHYNVLGARMVAGLIAKALGKEIKALEKHFVSYDYVVSGQGRGNYLKLQNVLSEVPKGKKTWIYILDGKWTICKSELKDKKVKFRCYPGVELQIRP